MTPDAPDLASAIPQAVRFADGRYEDDLRVAHVLANHADDIATQRFQALDLQVETKPDLTPVSDADQAVEESLRTVLAGPGRGTRCSARSTATRRATPVLRRCWMIDPIDGTKNYVRGVPVWATLIALMDGPDVVVGMVSAPALGRRWWAAQGQRRVHRPPPDLGDPAGSPGCASSGDASFVLFVVIAWEDHGKLDGFLEPGPFGVAYAGVRRLLVAPAGRRGRLDMAAEPEVTLWDMAALR